MTFKETFVIFQKLLHVEDHRGLQLKYDTTVMTFDNEY